MRHTCCRISLCHRDIVGKSNPSRFSWTGCACLQSKRPSARVAVLEDLRSNPLNTVERYDTRFNKWRCQLRGVDLFVQHTEVTSMQLEGGGNNNFRLIDRETGSVYLGENRIQGHASSRTCFRCDEWPHPCCRGPRR